jgi:fatty acid desaturase
VLPATKHALIGESPEQTALPVEFQGVRRKLLRSSAGLDYETFRRSLTPRYGRAWRDIALGYAAMAVTTVGATSLARYSASLPLAIVLGGTGLLAVLYGYWFAYLHLFLHEGAHFNLAVSRTLNDRLSNAFVGLVLLSDVKPYRFVHWQHHRHHGTPDDLEYSYFLPLGWGAMLRVVSGAHSVSVLLNRLLPGTSSGPVKAVATIPSGRTQLMLGSLLHAAILLALYLRTGSPIPVVAWIAGFASFFPLFATVRPILEHRSEEADPGTDYFARAHGVVNRLFGDGLVASTFGGAGFNRHLIHHWEPQVPYTRLRELENFLVDTPVSAKLKARQTTYWRAFLRLYGN